MIGKPASPASFHSGPLGIILQRMRSAIRNGEIIREEEAVLPVTYREVQYSFSVYEALRITGGHIVHLDDHLRRLEESCRSIKLEHPFTDEMIGSSINALIRADGIVDATARILVVGGPAPLFFVTYSSLLSYPSKSAIILILLNPYLSISLSVRGSIIFTASSTRPYFPLAFSYAVLGSSPFFMKSVIFPRETNSYPII